MDLIDRNDIKWMECEFADTGCHADEDMCKGCLLSTVSHKQVMSIPTIEAIPKVKINTMINEISSLQTYILYEGDTKKVDLDSTISIINKYTE